MAHITTVHKIAQALPRFEALKLSLCTMALVFSCSSYAQEATKPQQASSSINSVANVAEAKKTSSLSNTNTTASGAESLRNAIDKETTAIDKSGAYVNVSTLKANSDKVSPSSEQVGSNVKEKAKVYRDPYGNRLKAPPRKQSFEQRSQEEARTAEKIEQSNLNRPTSSLSKVATSTAATVASTQALASNDSKIAAIKETPLKSAIVFFTKPEKSSTHNVDAMSGASTVKVEQNILGITEYEASLIAKYTKADMYRIERDQPYSSKHSELIMQSSDDMDSGLPPQSKITPNFDPSSYDVIFVGFPLWWSDMPMPLYSFFEDHDLSGKIVIPFCTYGNKSRNKVFTKISKLEANANVTIKAGLKSYRADIAKDGERIVKEWLIKLDNNSFKGLLPKGSEAKQQSAPQEGQNTDSTTLSKDPQDAGTNNTKARANSFAPGKTPSVKLAS